MLDVVMSARDTRWNWFDDIFRLDQHRIIRQVLLNCASATPDSLVDDVPRKAAEIPVDRETWKRLRP